MAEFVLELRSEEIPARMQPRATADLKRLTTNKLEAAGLAFETAESYATPRRLALLIDGLPERQPDTTEEKKGPRVGSPDKAIQGFLRANGLSSTDEAETRETDKGTFYFAVRRVEGRPTRDVLPGVIDALLQEFPWPKSMRWGTTTFRWIRPLRGIVAVFDGEPIDGQLELGVMHDRSIEELPSVEFPDAMDFTNVTVGHPFLAPQPITVTDAAGYRDGLAGAKVVFDPAERRRIIEEEGKCLAEAEGLSIKPDPGLLEEVAGMVEWPVVLMGRIDEAFMALPPEVLTVSMRTHQKYFALEDGDGRLAPRFLTVADMETADAGAAIRAGNERVLRARLADAQFFWEQDRKQALDERVAALQEVVFHEKLGTLHHKVDRMEALALVIAGHIDGAARDKVRSAARLAKADLTTGMVGEFPELQGVMGRYYALADGEAPEVAQAIAEHYSPLGPGERCPRQATSVAVALADKLDTLTGFFAIGERPTGSKDPYALRRAALGVIRLIVENGLRLPLAEVLAEALRLQPEEAQRSLRASLAATGGKAARGETAAAAVPHTEEALARAVLGFLADRLKVVLRDRGVRHDLIAAVFAVEKPGGGPEDDLVRLLARVEALRVFLESDDGANLLTAHRRATNIVRIEERRDATVYSGEADERLLTAEEEKTLHAALGEAASKAARALEAEDFTGAMAAMAALRGPVDAFFDHVTVNAEDAALRANRLRLLKHIDATLAQVADFSMIEGDRG